METTQNNVQCLKNSDEQKSRLLSSQKGSEIEIEKKEKLLNLKRILFKQLVHKIIDQVDSKRFNINDVLRYINEVIDDYVSTEKDQNEDIEKYLKTQIRIIAIELSKLPEIFIELLESETITSSFIEINILQGRAQILRLVLSRIISKLQSVNDQKNPLQEYIQQQFEQCQFLKELVKIVAQQIKSCFDYCSKQIMFKYLEEFQNLVKNNQIMNVYLIYKILREISNNSKLQIEEHLIDGIFRYSSEQTLKSFTHYIMEKFEVIKLEVGFDNDGEEKPKERIFQQSHLILRNLEENKHTTLTFRMAISKDGQVSLFMKSYVRDPKTKQQNSYADFMIKIDPQSTEFYVIRCQHIRKTWFIEDRIRHVAHIRKKAFQIINKNQFIIDAKYKQNGKAFDFKSLLENNKMRSIEDLTNTGGTLGKCLTDINKYSDASEFFKDISQRAILTHSFNTIFQRIPIIGYLLIAGSLTYSFYFVMKNKMNSTDKKIKDFGSLAIVASASIGTSIAGGIIGQMLIPVPVLGALIGTAIGGFLGERGGRKIMKSLQKQSFLQLIEYLKRELIDNKYWMVKKDILIRMGIDEQEFYKSVPQKMQDCAFLTMICFVLVCFYQSYRQKEYNKRIMQLRDKQSNLKKQNLKYLVIDEDEVSQKDLESLAKESIIKNQQKQNVYEKNKADLTEEERLELDILAMKKDEGYHTVFDLKAMILYLEEKNCSFIKNLKLLEKVTLSFLSKIT